MAGKMDSNHTENSEILLEISIGSSRQGPPFKITFEEEKNDQEIRDNRG